MLAEKKLKVWFVPGDSGGSLSIADDYCNMESQGWVFIRDHEVSLEIDVTSESFTKRAVENLEDLKVQIRAEAGMKCTAIDRTISQLLRLDYTPAADANAPEMKTIDPDEVDHVPF